MVAQVETKPTKKIPFIREIPFIGSIPAFLHDRLPLLVRLTQSGDVYGCHLGTIPLILFNKPEHVHRILVEGAAEDFDKGRMMHRVLRPTVGDGVGVFISEGEFHRRQRKLIAPPFQPRHIISYADTMVHYTEKLLQEWHTGDIIDMNQDMTNVTMSIIGKILFDADVFTEADELGHAVSHVLSHATYKLSNPFSTPNSWPTPANLRANAAAQLIRDRIQRMIDERRDHVDERNDFLSILLRAKDEDGTRMSDSQVMEECITLFSAGHETTATTLIWAWYLLCQHPEIYRRVQDEVDRVLQGHSPTYTDLANLPYCLQVFKEVMRLYPAAYVIPREALHDVVIDGYLLRKGEMAVICPYTLHRRADYFPDPEKFDPDRFTLEREKQLPRYAYLPFGAGPRICIGNHFAMMEGHLLLATLAQRATFTLLPGQDIKPDPNGNLTLRPSGKVAMRVAIR